MEIDVQERLEGSAKLMERMEDGQIKGHVCLP